MYPLSEGLFAKLTRCSVAMAMTLLTTGAMPSPISVEGGCIASVGNPGVRPSACLPALLRSLSIFWSCADVKMPRWVAWYLDLRSCSMTSSFRPGESLRLFSAVASLRTSVVIWLKCSLKSSIGLMWTPSILYDLFGGM